MATQTEAPNGFSASPPGYKEIFFELAASTKELIRNEVILVKAEAEHEINGVKRHLTQVGIFGGLLALSVFPFLAFLVIGLGNLLDGRYWLSSLIVAVVCAAVGGTMAYRAYKEMKENDLKFDRTRRTVRKESEVVQNKIEDIKIAAKGNSHEFAGAH